MSAYRDCPECGRVEAVKIDLLRDSDDVSTWDYPEITDTDCGCIISADHADTILKEFETWDLGDWIPEPF